MNLIASYNSNGVPQRKLLTHNGVTYRRIVAWVNSKRKIIELLSIPVWQEQIHTGDFHNIIDSSKVSELEDVFEKEIKNS